MATDKLRMLPGVENPLLNAAADWFVRVQNDDMSVEEIAQWQQWLAASPAHRSAFERMQTLWHDFGAVPDRVPPSLPRRMPQWALAAGVGAVMIAAAASIYIWNPLHTANSVAMTVFETQSSEHREVQLPDGSKLTLGAKSLVWIDFSDKQRTLTLDRGEAFFDVARDKQRPFMVRAGEATITAVGTAFNIRRSGERVLVAVTDGAINVASQMAHATTAAAARQTRVDAGHQIEVEPSLGTTNVSVADPQIAIAWRSGRRQYLGEPLKYVVADLNRYYAQQITIGDPDIGELLLTGTVFENDIDAWLRSVVDLLPVEIERPTAGRIVLTQRR